MRKTTVTIASGLAAAVLLTGAAFAGDVAREDAVNESLPSIANELRDLRRRLERMELASRLESASVGRGGIRMLDQASIRSGDFDGDLSADDFGTTGWAIGGNGAVVVETLAVRDNAGTVVGNDYMGPSDIVSLDAISSDYAPYASTTIQVPDWAATAKVAAIAGATFTNQTGSGHTVWAGFNRIVIGGDVGVESYAHVNQPDSVHIGAQHGLAALDVSALTSFDVVAEGQRSNRSFASASNTNITSGGLTVIVSFSA